MTARGKRRFSASDWLFGLAMLFAVAIHLPALFAPLTVDDFGQRAMTHGSYPPGDRGPFSLYDFVDDTNRQELVDRGIFPWWTHPHMVARFLRPLSSLSLYLDYRIGPDTAFRGHAENFLWWVAASACVYLLAARLFDRRVARLACFAFTACPCHAIPLIWVANRDTFISQVLGIAGLLGYVAWRRRGRVRDGAVSLALFALAMAAGEYSFCFAGYIAAFELVGTRDPLPRRVLGMLPFGIPAAGYLIARAAFHYGARASGLYFDPFWDFGRFIRGALERFTVLLCTGWLGASVQPLVAPSTLVVAITLAVATPLIAAAIVHTFRVMNPSFRLDAAWLLLGSVLSILPVLAVIVSYRIVGVPMIGISTIVALVISEAWFPARPPERRALGELTALVAVGLAFIHLVLSSYRGFTATQALVSVNTTMNRRVEWVRDHAEGKSQIVVLRAETIGSLLPWMLCDLPLQWRVLSFQADHVLVLRTGERSLELVASPRPLFRMDANQIFRPPGSPLHAGDSIEVRGMKVTILQLEQDGTARSARFDFDRDLDDPSILWIKETASGFEEQALPRKGQGEPLAP
jgi:hypothetical protein